MLSKCSHLELQICDIFLAKLAKLVVEVMFQDVSQAICKMAIKILPAPPVHFTMLGESLS